MSKVRCYECQVYGHYAAKCPNKKKGKGKGRQHAAAAEDVPHKKTKKDDFEELADGIRK